ncbi:unnamed protein product [Larinioides sclopetarius]|uniref:Uncharacterized protein n=1 Tax=Larinioides sclopetarius TaxID=280406 RepID=A0AAV1YYI5_9ARAC
MATLTGEDRRLILNVPNPDNQVLVSKIPRSSQVAESCAGDSITLQTSITCQLQPIENLLEKSGGHNQLRIIADTGLQDSVSQNFIVDASRLFTSVYDNLKNAFKDEGSNDMLSEMAKKYKDNPELVTHFSNWCKSRKELIRITNLAAENLDQPLFMINLARMIGSFVEILNLLNLDVYEKFSFIVASYAYNISQNLGFIMERALELAPHLRFMGVVSSFLDILRSQVIIGRVVNAMKNDKNMFTPLKKWVDETKELDESVKKLFPYGINKEITLSIERALEDLGKEEKIFTATVLSNLIEDPSIYKNGKFLAEVFLFCRSDVAKEWFKRLTTGASSSSLECDTSCLRTQLQQLEGACADSELMLEIGKFSAEQLENASKKQIRSNFGRLIVCGMSGMSIFCCYQNIKTGSTHRYSDRLKELSKNATDSLNAMEKIRF